MLKYIAVLVVTFFVGLVFPIIAQAFIAHATGEPFSEAGGKMFTALFVTSALSGGCSGAAFYYWATGRYGMLSISGGFTVGYLFYLMGAESPKQVGMLDPIFLLQGIVCVMFFLVFALAWIEGYGPIPSSQRKTISR